MPSIGSLNAILTLNSKRFEQGMDRSRKQLKGYNKRIGKSSVLTKAFSGAVTRAGAALTTLAGAAGVGRLFSSVESFNQEMRSSQAIMGELSENQMQRMEESAIRVARATRTGASEAARSFLFFASAGVDAVQSITALPQVAKFAQAGMFDMATATDLATDAQSALGMTVDDAQQNLQNLKRTTDVLVKANTLANASVEQFSQSLTRKAGAALKNLGKDIEEGVAVLAAFADQGVKAEQAGTALDIVLRRLAIGARENQEAWKQFGVQVFDSEGEFRNIGKIISDLTDRLEGMSDKQKDATLAQLGFTAKNLAFVKTLLGTGDAIQRYERLLREAGGTTERVADKQLTPFAKGWNQLSGAIVGVGKSLSGTINAFGKLLGFIGRNLKTIIQMTASFVAFVVTGPAVIAAITGIISAVRNLSSGIALLQVLIAGPKGLTNLLLGVAAATAVWVGLEFAINDTTDAITKADKNAKQLDKDLKEATKGATDFKSAFDDVGDSVDEVAKKTRDHPLMDFAKRLRERTRTPLEELRQQVLKIWMAFQEGLINVETFRRGLSMAGEDFKAAAQNQRPQRFDAFQRGQRRTIDRVLAFQSNSAGAKIDQEQLKEQRQQTQWLKKIHKGVAIDPETGTETVVNF